MPLADQITPLVQRQAEDEEEEEEPLQAKPVTAQTSQVSPTLAADIQSIRGSGQPLDPATRAFMEPRFGYDFSMVRVHTNAKAAGIAHSIKARAFTLGQDIFLGNGQNAPGTSEGQRLMAHELTHVVQQNTLRYSGSRLQRLAIPRSHPFGRVLSTSTVTINITVLNGATDNSARDVATSNRIFRRASCGLRVSAGARVRLTAPQTRSILGRDNKLEEPSGATVSAEERRLLRHNRTAGQLTAYYVPAFNPRKRGTSLQSPRHGVADSLLMGNSAATDTFTHELGHILGRNHRHHSDANNLMARGSIRNVGVDNVTPTQCRSFLTATSYPSGTGPSALPLPSRPPMGDFPAPPENERVA